MKHGTKVSPPNKIKPGIMKHPGLSIVPFALLTLTLTSGGCASAQATAQRSAGKFLESLTISQTNRQYILRVPKNYDPKKPTPVVVVLHGLTSDMNAMDGVLRLGEKVDKEGFIAVVPNGLPDGFRGWNAGFFKLAGSPSDTDFISSILDKVEKEFNIDKKREFIMGHSNGAMMSMFLGSKLATRIAAVAGISGTIGIPGTDPSMRIPNLPTAISAMFIHGMKDTVVAYKKGDKAMLVPIGAQESAAWWAEQTKATPTTPKDESSFTRQTYTNGTLGCEVELISCKFGTHEVPGGYYATGQEKASGIIALDEIWRFFSSHPKA